MEVLSPIFQPINLRNKMKYRVLKHYHFTEEEIMSRCQYLRDYTIHPQVKGRLMKIIAKRHLISVFLLRSWYASFVSGIDFVYHIDKPKLPPPSYFSKKIPFIQS